MKNEQNFPIVDAPSGADLLYLVGESLVVPREKEIEMLHHLQRGEPAQASGVEETDGEHGERVEQEVVADAHEITARQQTHPEQHTHVTHHVVQL